MYDGRLGLEVVYFNQRTTDALLPITPSPGSGFTSSQLRNLGELRSWGVEVMLEAAVLQRDNLSLDVMVAPSYLKQWVEDMGGIADFRLGSRRRWQSLHEGLWPGMHIAPIADPNQPYILAGGAGIDAVTQLRDIAANTLKTASGADSLVVIGRPQPNQTIDMSATLRWGNFTVQNIFEGARGFVQSNETLHLRNALKSNRLMAELEYHLANPTENPAKREALIHEFGSLHNGIISNTIFDGDYLRWAELTVAYRFPEAWAQKFGSSGTTVSLGVKNVHVFSDYFNDFKRGWIDPGTRGIETTDAFLQNIDYLKTPAPRRFVLSIRTDF